MLMRSPRRSEVRAVTVVSGNVWAQAGAAYMSRNLELLGAPGVPVRIGAEAPLVHTAAMSKLEQALAFAGAFALPNSSFGMPRGGVDFMLQTIEAAPGKVTILAIGPLTNLAIALRTKPDIQGKINAVVIMGGNVQVEGNASKAAEFNFWFDPEAAAIVLRSAIPKKVLFALDVCNRVTLTKAIFDSIIAVKTPITDLYREDFGNRYPGFLKNPNATGSLWDELAAAYVIDPSLVTRSENGYLDVETTFGPRYGATKPLDRKLAPDATPVQVVLDMDFDRVFAIYKRALMAR